MNLAKQSSKAVLCLITLVYWLLSASLAYIGINMLLTFEKYGDLISYIYSIIPAFIILGMALVIFLIGIIGICGLFSENKCLLATFFFLLSTLLSLQISALVLMLIYRDHVNRYVRSLFDELLDSYGHKQMSSLSQNFDFIQHKLECCGQFNYTDWKDTWWYENSRSRVGSVPQSCCVNYAMNSADERGGYVKRVGGSAASALPNYCRAESPEPTPVDNYYPNGCYAKLRSLVNDQFVYISGVCLGLLVVQFVGIFSTCILMFIRRSDKKQPGYVNIATHDDIQYNLHTIITFVYLGLVENVNNCSQKNVTMSIKSKM
ncbi:tetraspanin-3-like [Brachionus plicatilis]|uniref:Tetraspanin-3-like n=1 Tax=Brachionus plicatilis TaxID=10195 RepID=A0A3M7S7G1_BRAPC|nr:tetraspanin-3-like [Brachionus plicatilis]